MQYNLLAQPWLPCLDRRRNQVHLSIHQLFARAPDLLEIIDPSPLVTVALHRLLIALLHRALNGPADEDAWSDLRDRGCFDMAKLEQYLTAHESRFDLFHPAFPFYQTPGLDEAYGRSVAGLAHELAAGNNTTLFDHTTEVSALILPAAKAARLLVALQAFAVGGLVTFDDKAHKSADAAPLAKGAVMLVKGRNLFETLVLNLVVYNPGAKRPYGSSKDRAAWESDEPVRPMDRIPLGYADWLTWQSRRIRLFPVAGPDGVPVVFAAAIMKGHQLPGGESRRSYETMMAFVKVLKPSPGQEPWPAMGFREDRALWRDSLPLYGGAMPGKQEGEPPQTLRFLATVLDRGERFPLDCHGLVTDKAAVLLWRHERLTVPLRYLADPGLSSGLAYALDEARRTARALEAAMEQFAGLLLAPRADIVGGHKPDPDACRRLVEHLGAGRLYWSRLELPFRDLVEALPRDMRKRQDDQIEYGSGWALPAWSGVVRTAARAALEETIRSLRPSMRALKADVAAWRTFHGVLKKLQEGVAS